MPIKTYTFPCFIHNTQIKTTTILKVFGTMSSQKTSIQNVLAPTTRPPPKSKPQTTGTHLPTIQQLTARRPKWFHTILKLYWRSKESGSFTSYRDWRTHYLLYLFLVFIILPHHHKMSSTKWIVCIKIRFVLQKWNNMFIIDVIYVLN